MGTATALTWNPSTLQNRPEGIILSHLAGELAKSEGTDTEFYGVADDLCRC